MRIGGGIGSNEGDTPIYIANIHPHGCIGKSKQMKVNIVLPLATTVAIFSTSISFIPAERKIFKRH